MQDRIAELDYILRLSFGFTASTEAAYPQLLRHKFNRKKQMKEERRGGKRIGAGRKPDGDEAKITTSIVISTETKRFIDQLDVARGVFIEALIQKSKQWKEWKQ